MFGALAQMGGELVRCMGMIRTTRTSKLCGRPFLAAAHTFLIYIVKYRY